MPWRGIHFTDVITDSDVLWLNRTLITFKKNAIPWLWLCDDWGQSSQPAFSRKLSISGEKDSRSLSRHFKRFPLFFLPFTYPFYLPVPSFSLLFPWRIKIAAGEERCRPRSSAHVLLYTFDSACICSVLFACCWGAGAQGHCPYACVRACISSVRTGI